MESAQAITPLAPPHDRPADPPVADGSQGRRIRAAWMVAGAADLLQVVFFPMFSEGWLSPLNDCLDVAVALVLTKLIGFHWSFLPTLVVELLPVVEAAPTWTASVFLATRAGRLKGEAKQAAKPA